jgi:hypothetical protein
MKNELTTKDTKSTKNFKRREEEKKEVLADFPALLILFLPS